VEASIQSFTVPPAGRHPRPFLRDRHLVIQRWVYDASGGRVRHRGKSVHAAASQSADPVDRGPAASAGPLSKGEMMTGLRRGIVAMVSAGSIAASANAATARREPFGALPDGTPVESVVLTGANGVSARIMTLGATLQALNAPDRSGHIADVTLGYDDAASYVTHPNYWGQTIDRYANRVAGGRFM